RDFHVTGVQTCALPIYVLSGAKVSSKSKISAITSDMSDLERHGPSTGPHYDGTASVTPGAQEKALSRRKTRGSISGRSSAIRPGPNWLAASPCIHAAAAAARNGVMP